MHWRQVSALNSAGEQLTTLPGPPELTEGKEEKRGLEEGMGRERTGGVGNR